MFATNISSNVYEEVQWEPPNQFFLTVEFCLLVTITLCKMWSLYFWNSDRQKEKENKQEQEKETKQEKDQKQEQEKIKAVRYEDKYLSKFLEQKNGSMSGLNLRVAFLKPHQ